MPFFSVILPTFNQVEFLKKSVDSVLNQTFKDFELIIIDNYSNDGTRNFLQSLKDDRINIQFIKNNGMYVKSNNLGIKNSKSEWLAFIDSDDRWSIDKLQVCYETIYNNKKADLIYHSVSYLNKFYNNIIKEKSKKTSYPIEKNLYLNGNFIAHSSVVVRKKKMYEIDLFSESKDFYGWEDYDAWIRISKTSNKFYFVNKVLASLWFGKENISNLKLMQNILDKIYKYHNKECLKKFKFEINDTWWFKYNKALHYFKKKDYIMALKFCKDIPKCELRFYIRFFFIKYYSILIKNYNLKKKFRI